MKFLEAVEKIVGTKDIIKSSNEAMCFYKFIDDTLYRISGGINKEVVEMRSTLIHNHDHWIIIKNKSPIELLFDECQATLNYWNRKFPFEKDIRRKECFSKLLEFAKNKKEDLDNLTDDGYLGVTVSHLIECLYRKNWIREGETASGQKFTIKLEWEK